MIFFLGTFGINVPETSQWSWRTGRHHPEQLWDEWRGFEHVWRRHAETFDSAEQGIFKVRLETSSYSNNRQKYSYFHLFFQDTENSLLKEARLKLEDATFDIQCFISEHTQFLTPAQSSYLLKFLSTTQRAFRDQTERLVAQRSALDVLLDNREREDDEKVCLGIHFKTSHMFPAVCLCSIR